MVYGVPNHKDFPEKKEEEIRRLVASKNVVQASHNIKQPYIVILVA